MIRGTQEVQIRLEEEQQGKKIEKYLREINEAIVQGRLQETKEGQLLIRLGYEPLRDKIEEYLATPSRGQLQKDKNFLRLMCDDPSVLSFVVLSSVISIAGNGNNALSIAAKTVASNIKRIYFFDNLKKNNPKLHTYLGTEYKRASRARKTALIAKHIKSLYKIDFEGNENALSVRIGTFLIDLLIKSGANIIAVERKKATYYNNYKRKYIVRLTRDAEEVLLSATNIKDILLTTNLFPMVVQPNDWLSTRSGGYLRHKISLVKTHTRKHRQYIERQDLSKILPVINKLQRTPWRINRKVLNVMYDIFTNNMIDPKAIKTLPRCFGGMPSSKNYEVRELLEEEPEYLSMEPKTGEKTVSPDWVSWNKIREQTQIDLDAEKSRRIGFVFSLDVAQKMIDYKKFWYVYQLDYRGRVYPHNEFLNPQCKSYIKAMLEFGNGLRLNEVGVYWLKIHIANCYGLDKEEFEDRIEFVEGSVETMLRIADNPMDNLKDWTYVDSPYEYLAGCYAYQDYLEGRPVNLPIQLDATCSGLQFYSGLLLDKQGAKAVNVIGQNREDIYQNVADRVNKKLVDGDYKKVMEYVDSEGVSKSVFTYKEAKSITGNVTRGVTKRNTMTIPYSVTMRGMSNQNHDYMHKCVLENKVYWEGDPWIVNGLITDLNYRSIYEEVSGAGLGQKYLKDVASRLTKVASWKTPIYGFPVVQQAYKKKVIHIRTPIGRMELIKRIDGVDKRKQMSSIAANYIHSLDSTLLLYCIDHVGVDIGVIHDCFLVHPNYGEDIRTQYKEGYIKLMTMKPLEMFGAELDEEGKVEVPCIGTLDLEEVRDSKYIIS